MQRLRNTESVVDSSAEGQVGEEKGEADGEGEPQGSKGENQGKGESEDDVTTSSVSLEVTVENSTSSMAQGEGSTLDEPTSISVGPSLDISQSDTEESFLQSSQLNSAPKPKEAGENNVGPKKAADDGSRRMAVNLGINKQAADLKPASVSTTDPSPAANAEKIHKIASPGTSIQGKIAATLHGNTSTPAGASAPERTPAVQGEAKAESDGSWCQTQLPEAMAERPAVVSVVPGVEAAVSGDVVAGERLRSDTSPMVRRDRDVRKTDRYSAEYHLEGTGLTPGQGSYTTGSSASLGRHSPLYHPDVGTVGLGMSGAYGNPYSSLYASGGVGLYGTGLDHGGRGLAGTGSSSSSTSDWQMDSVIEQIEKQMAAVLEKIEGDMPSLLEQISDCPAEPPRARSAHSSPATSRARTSAAAAAAAAVAQSTTPPPLPTSPRPPLPSLPHLTIPPPSYPPPFPPTQASGQGGGEQEERDGQRAAARSSQSPRAMPMSKGL